MNLQKLLTYGLLLFGTVSGYSQCPPQSLPFTENFNSSVGCFTITDGGTTTDTWVQAASGAGTAGGDIDGTGFMEVDSDAAGSGNTLDETLTSPYIDASNVTGTLFLEFDHFFRSLNTNDSVWVEVWDSIAWQTVYSTNSTVGAFGSPDQQQIDITTYANDSLQVRFRYFDNGSWAWYWLVDNFKVESVLCPNPTAVTVSANSATAFTVNLGSATDSIAFEWGPVGFTQGTGCAGTKATLGSLSVGLSNADASTCVNPIGPGACYDVYIANACPGGGYSGYSGPYTFCTPCATVNLPYTNSFNSGLGCFTVVDGGSTTDTWRSAPAGGGTSGGDLDGTGHVEVDSDDAGSGQTLVETLLSPVIDASGITGSLILEFDQYYFNASTDSIFVDVYDGTNWVNVYELSNSVGNFGSPNHQYIDITAQANAALQVRFLYKDNGVWAWYWLVDNFSVEEVLCSPSTNFMANYVGSDSVNLGWTVGTGTGIAIEYGPVGFSLGSGTNLNAGTSPLGINGLSPNTIYDFYLLDSCGSSVSDTTGPLNISTACLPVSLPYSEDFDNGQGCFTVSDGGTSTDTWVHAPTGGLTSGGDLDGTPFMEVDSDAAGSGETLIETLTSPIMDASAYMSAGSLSLIFDQYYNHIGSDSGTVEVFDGTSWVQVASFRQDLGAFSAPDSQNIDITPYANANLQVRFVYDDAGAWAWYWLIDNFKVEGQPCGAVSNIDTNSVGTNNVDFNWTSANGSLWNINWGPAGFRQGSGVSGSYVRGVSNTNYNLTGLQAGTCYDLYVQDTCVGIGNGDWFGPYTVCTDVSCFEPTNVVVSGVTSSSATVNWVGFATNFQYSLVTTPSAAPSSGTLGTSSTLSTSFSNLSSASSYCVYVRSICAPGDTSIWTGPICFNTSCLTFTAPFLEDFEGGSTTCWENDTITGGKIWSIGSGSTGGSITTPYGGLQNAVFTSSSGGPHVTRFISPVIDASALSATELSFWYGQEDWAGDQNTLTVYYRTGPSASWNQLWTDANDVSVWTQAVIAVPSNSSTLQFAFEGSDNYGRGNVLDDIRVDVPGGSVICPQVSNISVTNESCSTADLSWTSVTGGSIIEYGPIGFTPGTGSFTSAITSPFTLTGLSPNTGYDVYIADTCGLQDTGDYVGPTPISTNLNGVPSGSFNYTVSSSNILDYSFDASASTGTIATYSWDFGDGNGGVGANVTNTYAAAGSYTVTLIVAGDCGNDTTMQTIVDVSTNEFALAGLALYPNPASDKLFLQVAEGGAYSIQLNDASGRVVRMWNKAANSGEVLEFDVQGLKKGLYIINVAGDKGSYRERVLID
tara:strand:- start:826 stop:4776 length:3951 start_codon:yes stop_codon:yes gene_type:complete